jgi:hypothetical protein
VNRLRNQLLYVPQTRLLLSRSPFLAGDHLINNGCFGLSLSMW